MTETGQDRTPEVRRAHVEDVPDVKALLDAVSRWLVSKGINQWNYGRMPIETLIRRAQRGELYLCMLEGEVAGTVSVNTVDIELWGRDEGDCLYLHTLAVRPDLRGTGLAAYMMRWVEARARKQGKTRVRLDCLAHSERLRRYYQDAGYQEQGIKQMNETWIAVMFEKRL